jgi:hypothetical protein
MVGMVGKYAGALVLVRIAPLEEASLRYLELYRLCFFGIGICAVVVLLPLLLFA